MTSLSFERWQRIDAVYTAALDLPPEERPAFVSDACDGDDELGREVWSLIDNAAEADRLFGESATDFVPLLMDGASTDAEWGEQFSPGRRVGSYRIVEMIGRGGMGVVYLAERADDQFEKRVAIKLIKRGMDTDEVLERFRYEKQILASLEHPHIARLLDGGVSDDGRPYLVMEYVRGEPLDLYCDAHRLGLDARLALFQTVCRAVQHAHQKLVVHRDLKPSNILVTEEAEPRLLDFGIAKLLADDAEGAPHTRTGIRVLTPEYAAPEQVRGAPVSVASDIYALGVILYRLLSGRSPHERGQSSQATVNATADREAARPSTLVLRRVRPAAADDPPTPEEIARRRDSSPERLRRRLRGDLDSIVLKALENDPALRYGSVEQLLEDVRRHQAGLPVLAHTATRRYRAVKFLRRHRGTVVAVALVVLSLSGFAATMTVQQRRTARERDRAERERDKAEATASFLESLFAASDPFSTQPERTDTLRVRAFLERGAARIGQELSGQPVVQAQMLDVVGRVYHALGLYDQAQPLLEDALAARQQLGSTDSDIAESLTNLGLLLMDREAYDRAQQFLEQALETNTHGLGASHPATAMSMNELGALLRARGRYDEAEQWQRQALAILRQAPGDELHHIAEVTRSLASTLEFEGDYAAAEPLLRRSLDMRRALYGRAHPHVAVGLNDLSLVLQRQGKYDEAEGLIREAILISEAALGAEHPFVLDALGRLASVLYWKRDFAAAEPIYRRVLEVKRRLYGNTHGDVATALNHLASLLRETAGFDEAEALHREALAIVRASLGDDHADVAIQMTSLAATLQARGDCLRAEPFYREAMAIMTRALPPEHVRIPLLQSSFAGCLTALGRFGEAEPLLLESHRTLSRIRGSDDAFTQTARARLVALYTAWGNPARAAEYR